MKFSKKIIILILAIVILSSFYIYKKNTTSNYALDNIKYSEIDSLNLYHDDNILNNDVDNSDNKKILKMIEKITKEGSFSSLDDTKIFDNNFTENTASKDSDNYFIKVNFTSNKKLQLKNTSIICKYIIIDINNKTLYYWTQASSSINEMNIKNTNLNNIQEFLKSKF